MYIVQAYNTTITRMSSENQPEMLWMCLFLLGIWETLPENRLPRLPCVSALWFSIGCIFSLYSMQLQLSPDVTSIPVKRGATSFHSGDVSIIGLHPRNLGRSTLEIPPAGDIDISLETFSIYVPSLGVKCSPCLAADFVPRILSQYLFDAHLSRNCF